MIELGRLSFSAGIIRLKRMTSSIKPKSNLYFWSKVSCYPVVNRLKHIHLLSSEARFMLTTFQKQTQLINTQKTTFPSHLGQYGSRNQQIWFFTDNVAPSMHRSNAEKKNNITISYIRYHLFLWFSHPLDHNWNTAACRCQLIACPVVWCVWQSQLMTVNR